MVSQVSHALQSLHKGQFLAEVSAKRVTFCNYCPLLFLNVFLTETYLFRTALLVYIVQRTVAIPYRRFGATYRSHFKDRKGRTQLPLKMGPIGCTET